MLSIRSLSLLRTLLLVCCVFIATPAFAAKTFIVAPFNVNGPSENAYMGQAIPQMLSSRLYWQNNFHGAEAPAKTAITSKEEAEKALKAAQADYIIWGSLTTLGNNTSVDMKVLSNTGEEWPLGSTQTTANLIPGIQKLADNINTTIFNRPAENLASQPRPAISTPQQSSLNPGIRGTAADPRSPLNPNLRAQESPAENADRIQSQTLPFISIGMIIEDLNGNGQKEVILLEDNEVHVYNWNSGKLKPAGAYKASVSVKFLSIHAIDLNGDGQMEIIVNGVDKDLNPASMVLHWSDGKITVVKDRIRFYMNVIPIAPSYTPMLIGQANDSTRVVSGPIFEVLMQGNDFIKGGRVHAPEKANVFNFIYMPDPEGADKAVILNNSENLTITTITGSILAQTDETYSGTAIYVPEGSAMPGLGRDRVALPNNYYIPMRMFAKDLDGDGTYEVIVNRPISTAASFFGNFRLYPQGEIHGLYWDGIGLALQWKTGRIRGSIADIAITDLSGDGKYDLVINVNTYPGALATTARKTLIMVYPLNSVIR